MILVNGQRAILRKFNRCEKDDYFDDRNYKDYPIKVVPYNVEEQINFNEYTTKEATGYYQCSRFIDVQPGDQIRFIGKRFRLLNHIEQKENENDFHTIIRVEDNWVFNRVDNYILVVR